MSEYVNDAKVTSPIWSEAHDTLNQMREYLIQCRDEAIRRGDMASKEIVEYNAVLDRIQPTAPSPIQMAGTVSGALTTYSTARPEVRKPW